MKRSATFSSLSASERAAGLADTGTFSPLSGVPRRRTTLLVGRGRIGGRSVLLALTDGHDRGGTVGSAEARVFGELTAAAEREREPIVVCFDTGGVRVHEGPAALAATSAVGVALTRLALLGVPVASVISGRRGCFGAPAVVAATAHRTIVTSNAHWGLTGPKLLQSGGRHVTEAAGRAATSARRRFERGQASALVADHAADVREELVRFLATPLGRRSPAGIVDRCVERLAAMLHDLRAGRAVAPAPPRRRDLLQYSVRGHWRATGPETRAGHVHATWGQFDRRPAMTIIVGPERPHEGIGIEDAHTVARMVRDVIRRKSRERAPILIFLFCRGHANDVAQERAGLPAALAECLKSLVVARLLGHPLVCMLGGGAYGAAYLSLAAPCHRVLAIRGTTVAPMAPRVLAAFQRLRGAREAPETPQDLAQLIPEIRIVESVMRLPRVLHEEMAALRRTVRAEIGPAARLSYG